MSELAIETRSDYQLLSANITNSDRNADLSVDIKRLVSSFQIFEHIEKSYLTAEVIFADTANLLQDIDFQGGEKLTLEICQSEERNDGFTIKKEFLINKIESVTRSDEVTDAVILHCIEYHVFKSSLQNISRSYTGSASGIISKLLAEYVERDLFSLGAESVDNLKVIIPNLNPLEACDWLKKRAVSEIGMPYYLYSVLGVENLIMRDLGSMLEDPVINKNVPYIYAPSLNTAQLGPQKYYNILDFKISNNDDLRSIISEGLVGGEYYFYNTMNS